MSIQRYKALSNARFQARVIKQFRLDTRILSEDNEIIAVLLTSWLNSYTEQLGNHLGTRS